MSVRSGAAIIPPNAHRALNGTFPGIHMSRQLYPRCLPNASAPIDRLTRRRFVAESLAAASALLISGSSSAAARRRQAGAA